MRTALRKGLLDRLSTGRPRPVPALHSIPAVPPTTSPAKRLIRSTWTRPKPTSRPPMSCVCLGIASAGLPELSCVDLLGAINTTSDDDQQHPVKFVESPRKAYVEDEKAIVLLPCAANQDTEDSTSLRYHQAGIESRVKGRLTEVDEALALFPEPDAAPTIAIGPPIDGLKTQDKAVRRAQPGQIMAPERHVRLVLWACRLRSLLRRADSVL